MDEPSKPPDGPAVVAGLRQALDTAARCIELAKREAARVDASLRERSEGGARIEQVFLDTTRKRREQLLELDLRFEVPPLPVPQELPSEAPLSLTGKSDPSEVETLAPGPLLRV